MIDQEPYKIVRIMKAINYMFEVQKLTYYKISNIFQNNWSFYKGENQHILANRSVKIRIDLLKCLQLKIGQISTIYDIINLKLSF